jgi:hypothetical protein
MSGNERHRLPSDRLHSRRTDEEDDEAPPRPRRDPAKLTSAEVIDPPARVLETVSPGKLTRENVPRDAMTPGAALDYADVIARAPRIDRRAELGGAELDEHGALASAFSFIEEVSGGSPLPAELARRLAAELGVDLSAVRVHTDDKAARAAAELQARAFTIGNDIYFAAGAYDPASTAGAELIAHEVAHAAQNSRGGSPHGGRRVSRPDDSHERQADEFARRFVSQTRSFDASDSAHLVAQVRREGRRMNIPYLSEMERELGTSLDFVEAYTGEAAQTACQLMSAGEFAVRNIVAFADPSPQRETLLHELTHIVQMGGRAAMAPTQLRIGSLQIGARDSAAEHEARANEGGDVSRVAVSADPDVVHRTGPEPEPWDPTKAKERCAKYLAGLPRADPAEPAFGHATEKDYRYADSSATYFMREAYIASALAGVNISDNAKKEELQKLFGVDATAKELGLVKLAGGSRWAWVNPADAKWAKEVKLVPERIFEEASITDKWKNYLEILNKPTIKPHKIKPKPVALKDKAKTDDEPTTRLVNFTKGGGVPLTETELGKCRDAIEDAFVAVAKFHWNGGDAPYNDAWGQFYHDVVKPEGGAVFSGGYAQMQGTIFGRIATEDMNKAGLNVSRQETFFVDPRKRFKKNTQTYKLNADGFQLVGDTIKVIDFKSGGEPGGPEGDMMKAAHDYNVIATQKGVKVENIAAVTEEDAKIKHVMYVFPTKELAQKWAPKLKEQIPGEGVLVIVPDVGDAGIGTVQMSMNPTFEIALKNKTATTHHFVAPPIAHPGISVKEATITTKAAGAADVAGGEVVFDVAMGDALKQQNIKKPLTPEAGNKGKIENKLPGLQGDLSKMLKGVDVDAKVTDDGVEATLSLKAGTKIGVVDITDAAVTVKYGQAGLSASGTVGLSYKGGKVKGTIQVGWASGAWTFTGTLAFPEGMVDGLSAFQATVSYGAGHWTIGVDRVSYTRKIKAITLTGTAAGVKFDVDKGDLSGLLTLDADLGMFGTASGRAELKDNKLTKAEISYDSPELKYPAKSDKPTFKGTIGGTLTYENDKFSGAIRGTANLNVPALSKLAGDSGIGLAVDAKIGADGGYSGTIKTTTPLKFGEHFEVPSIGCTIKEDGAVEGDFAIKVKKIKYLENAEVGCKIDKDGFHVVKADVHAEFGKPTDKMWGSLDVGYEEAKGLKITGTLNVKIKEGMVAKGTLTYNSEKNTIDVALTVDEITLFDFKKSQNLFKFTKQIPVVSFYNIIGIYLDLGLDLDFDFSMKLGLKPTITLDGLSFETWEYSKISAEIELLGQLRAALIATPKVGLGLFAISPSLLRGGGGIKVPITGEALLKPTGKLKVGYSPSGTVDGDATVGMQLTFGIKGAVKPYAEAAVLDGAWNPSWTGDSLADFEILPPKELFNFTLDLAGDMKPKEPAIPTTPQAPTTPTAAKQVAQDKPKTSEVGGDGPGKDATPPTSGPAGGAADDSMFKMASLTGALKGLPGYATISGFMEKAGKVWDKIKGFFGRVAKAFKSFFESIGNAVEEVLNGFAAEGLNYLPKLIKKIVGDTTWDIIEPIVNAAASSAEQILQLFETEPPKNVADFFPWGLKLMQKAFGIGFGSIGALISALQTMLTRLAGLAKKIVTKMVQDGMIGVKRHEYYYWFFGEHYFLAADEYKIHVLGTSIDFRETGMLLNPNDVVGAGLFDVLERMGVPATNNARSDRTGDTYRDRWA